MKVNLYQMFVNDKRLPYLETVRETDCEDYKTYSSPAKIAELLKEVFLCRPPCGRICLADLF